MKIAFSALMIIALSLGGCGKATNQITEFTIHADASLDASGVQKVNAATDVLFAHCSSLKGYLPDVVNNTANLYDADGFSEKGDFGWKEFVEFDFTISDTPKVVPARYRAAGHHCRFRVSGNELATQKTVCAHLCQGKEAKVDNTYSLYLGKTEREKTRENYESIKIKAMSGDYQAQRNLAYGYSSFPYQGQDMNPVLGCAWRIVILKSGNERVDRTDVNNKNVYCDLLTRDERSAAEAQAKSLLKKLPN